MKESLTFAEKDLAGLLQALQTSPSPSKTDSASGTDLVIVITSESLGHGSDHLGRILMKFFLQSLTACALKPRAIILMNDGILLAVDSSEVAGSLAVLHQQGVKVLVEGTSTDYHQVEQRIKCGEVASMLSICGEILGATRVLSI